MTDSAPPRAPARPVRIGLYVAAVVAGLALVGVVLWVRPHGTASSSAEPSAASPAVSASASASATSTEATGSAAASVAASLNPASAGPEITPIPIPETGTDLSWQRVATFGGAPNVFVLDVAAGPAGYVAVGGRTEGPLTEIDNGGPPTPQLWRSADGITWTQGSADAFGAGFPLSIASDGAQYLTVLQEGPTTLVYRSVDGVVWQAVKDPPGGSDGYIRKVIRGPRGFVAIGRLSGPAYHGAFWSSADGITWTLRREETDNSEALDIVAGADAVVAVGSANAAIAQPYSEAAWYSADGMSWLRRDPKPFGSGQIEAVAATSGGFFAAGWVDVGIVIWRSSDGMSWAALPVETALGPDFPGDSGSVVGAFSFSGSEYVAGYASCCGFPMQHTYLSRNGTDWVRVHRDAAFAATHLGTVLVEADRVVAAGNVLGNSGFGETGGIWIGRAP